LSPAFKTSQADDILMTRTCESNAVESNCSRLEGREIDVNEQLEKQNSSIVNNEKGLSKVTASNFE
jgi:hypothetical protein